MIKLVLSLMVYIGMNFKGDSCHVTTFSIGILNSKFLLLSFFKFFIIYIDK